MTDARSATNRCTVDLATIAAVLTLAAIPQTAGAHAAGTLFNDKRKFYKNCEPLTVAPAILGDVHFALELATNVLA